MGRATMTSRAQTGLERRVASALCAAFLFAVNAVVYATHPRLIALFRRRVGRYPNVAEPVSVNEKVTWRKLFDRNPLFPVLQDKLAARDLVAARCPDLALPEILWRGHDPFAIPFDRIREPVVIKTNHGCGYNYFIDDPAAIDRVAISVFFARALSQKWSGIRVGEWAYGAIKPAIYVEKMLLEVDGSLVDDCKINVYAGKAHLYSLTRGRYGQRETVYFDAHDRRLEATLDEYGAAYAPTPGPLHERARTYAEALFPELDAIRVDCYIHQGRVWFGEFTIYPGSGFQVFNPRSFGIYRGQPWNILKSHYFSGAGLFRRLYRRCLETRACQRAPGARRGSPAPGAPNPHRIGGA
jgi:hypothetical protein